MVAGRGIEEQKISRRAQCVVDIEKVLSPDEVERSFTDKKINRIEPKEEEIMKMMEIIGNISHSVPLDCGACGYNTCRAKAISMIHGKSPKTMCLMYSFEKARSMSNLVMDNTPNIIMIIDSELRVKEFNRKAEEIFRISKNEAMSMYIFDFVEETSDFDKVFRDHNNLIRQRRQWKSKNMTVLVTAIYVSATDCILTIIEDVSDEEKHREYVMNQKLHTAQTAQDIIEKQMSTAQEIAGLLGETTAHTKVILTKLKNFIMMDEDSIREDGDGIID